MNAAHDVTVHFLPELEPTLAARDAARELFEKQTGERPTRFYSTEHVWGWMSDDAVLLFRWPA